MAQTTSRPRIIDRRTFIKGAAAVTGGVVGSGLLDGLSARHALAQEGRPPRRANDNGGYGPLANVADRRDGATRLALPAGFSYVSFGIEGTPMSDGNPTPRAHDGMAAFALPNGNVRLVRNHEDRDIAVNATVKGDPARAYDQKGGGGTTSLEVRVTPADDRELVRDFMSLNGTIVNCAGGLTPWGSWLSCEETTQGPTHGWLKKHGYIFEVPASATDEVIAEPLTAMGRFVHEAVAIDPRTGIVYETEDRAEAGFYRFLPSRQGDLAAGGQLQMLAVKGQPNFDTREGQQVGRGLPVAWVDIGDPDPASAEGNPSAVYHQGYALGGATFGRLEGCWYGDGSVFLISTSGGDQELGQVWEYRPAGRSDGVLSLVFESPNGQTLSGPDNITTTPRGGLLLCEDGDEAEQFLRGLTRDGRIFDFATNRINGREWAGATFAPDGETLFVNIQGDTRSIGPGNLGYTFAIWGPWRKGVL